MTAVRHRARLIALGAGLIVVVLSVFLATRDTAGQPTPVKNGDQPRLRLETLDGRRVGNGDYAGKVLYINFWNTWCEPCKREEPVLAEFFSAHAGDDDFAMLAIVHRDTRGAVEEWVASHPEAGYEVVFDPEESTARAFGVTRQPESYMLNEEGRIVALQKSEMSRAGLEAMLERAREESRS